MKLFFVLLLFSTALLSAQTAALPPLMPVTPRKISIGKVPKLQLVKNGKVNFKIALDKNSSPAVKLASQELAEHLSKVFNARIERVYSLNGETPLIIVGSQVIAREWGINPAAFDRDGFIIRTKGSRILIIGRDDPQKNPIYSTLEPGYRRECATLFGVYDFLERFAGMRFYFPGSMGIIAPQKKDWTLPDIDIYDRPDWIQRRFSMYNHANLPTAFPADMKKNIRREAAFHQLRNRFETILLPCCHGMACLQLIDRFARKRPEYFALKEDGKRNNDPNAPGCDASGHICFSNKGIQQELVKDGIAFLKCQKPETRGLTRWHKWWHPVGIPMFDMMPADGLRLCVCPECKKHFGKDKAAANEYIWRFFIDTANKIKAGGGKGYVSTMAYAQYGMIPKAEIPSHMKVMLATYGPWNLESPVLLKKEIERIKNWSAKLNGRTWVWTYPGKYSGSLAGIPNSTPRAIGKWFKLVRPYIFGGYIECNSDVFLFNHLNQYIFSRIAWNNAADIDALLSEYYTAMYGKGAPQMKEFFETVETLWMKRIGGKAYDTPEGPKIVKPSDIELWGDIYSPARMKHLEGLFSKAKGAVKGNSLEYKRIAYMEKEFFGPLKAQFNAWHSSTAARDSFIGFPGEKLYLRPTSGNANEVRTTVTYRREKGFFYFHFDCEEPHTDKMSISNKGGVWNDSEVELLLDPSGERKEYYQMMINAGGKSYQLRYSKGAELPWKSNAVITTKIIPGKGYTVDVKLPEASLGTLKTDLIPADFCRVRGLRGVKVKELTLFWRPLPGKFCDIANFGRLSLGKKQKAAAEFDFAGPIPHKRYVKNFAAHNFLDFDTKDYISGGRSLILTKPNNWFSGAVKLAPGAKYRLSYYAKLENVKKESTDPASGFLVRVYDGGKQYFRLPPMPLTGTAKWKHYSYTFRTSDTAGSKNGWLNFSLCLASGKVWIDNIRLERIEK